MDELYSSILLAQLDEIILILSKDKMITGDRYPRVCFDILEKETWVENQRYENGNIIVAMQGKNFSILLAGGTFSERYNRKVEFSKSRGVTKHYNVTNINSPHSTFATGEYIMQTILTGNFQVTIEEAIKQIKQEDSLTASEKNEIIDYFDELKNADFKGEKPVNSTLRGLAKWSEKLITLGGALANIYTVIEPFIAPFLPAF